MNAELQLAVAQLLRWIDQADLWEQQWIRDEIRDNPRYVIADGRRLARQLIQAIGDEQ
jgi:hypothetical protein